MSRRWMILATGFLAATVVCTMFLGGCDKKALSGGWTVEETAALFSGNFSADAEITLDDLEMTAALTRQDGMTTISLTAPEHLEGLSFTVNGSNVNVAYKGLSVDAGSMPVPALGTAVSGVLDTLSRPELLEQVTDEAGASAITGSTENGTFTLTITDEAPSVLDLPELGLSCRFVDFSPIESGGSPIPSENSTESSGNLDDSSSSEQNESLPDQDVSSLQQG